MTAKRSGGPGRGDGDRGDGGDRAPDGEPTRSELREQSDDLVRFFEALPAAARREYAALAALDREHGEDVLAEERAEKARRRS